VYARQKLEAAEKKLKTVEASAGAAGGAVSDKELQVHVSMGAAAPPADAVLMDLLVGAVPIPMAHCTHTHLSAFARSFRPRKSSPRSRPALSLPCRCLCLLLLG